ncbi:GNAT family N-acetyltransferase [Porticoccus sp.]|uniref:GNAT family N-acetyltransferase n=1 Tax=Porticoccus sp. TaxID=2024853 RepID=UPI003F69CF7D
MDLTVVQTQAENNIADTIFDALFINERRKTSSKVAIDHIRGWSTSVKDAWANRVAYTGDNCDKEKVREVQQFFNALSAGVTWVVDEESLGRKLPEMLVSSGFKPSRFHQVAGMVLEGPAEATHSCEKIEIEIREVDDETVQQHIQTVVEASGLHSEQYVRHIMAPDENISSPVYFAYKKHCPKPIGYAKSCFLENGKVHILLGAAVLPEYRNLGLYSALLQYRLDQAEKKGVSTHVTQSHRSSSFSTCVRFGFREVSSMEFYEWGPKP